MTHITGTRVTGSKFVLLAASVNLALSGCLGGDSGTLMPGDDDQAINSPPLSLEEIKMKNVELIDEVNPAFTKDLNGKLVADTMPTGSALTGEASYHGIASLNRYVGTNDIPTSKELLRLVGADPDLYSEVMLTADFDNGEYTGKMENFRDLDNNLIPGVITFSRDLSTAEPDTMTLGGMFGEDSEAVRSGNIRFAIAGKNAEYFKGTVAVGYGGIGANGETRNFHGNILAKDDGRASSGP